MLESVEGDAQGALRTPAAMDVQQVAISTSRTEAVTSMMPAAQDSKQVKRIVGLDPHYLQFSCSRNFQPRELKAR